MKIRFNKPYITGKEIYNIFRAHENGHLAGDGEFTKKCHYWLVKNIKCEKALLTHSCTAALEMTALLLGLKPGDEVILPSYTFVSTANAFVLRGATPVFVDIRADTLNIDESKIEEAITKRTKAICVVHYAGVSCEMDAIMNISNEHKIPIIEDSAQGICSYYKGKPLGSFGSFGTLSFHETKNVICGEGGALLLNDNSYIEQAEHIREKGTNRSNFFRGEVDKYTWVDKGSSFLPGELTSAFLSAQLEEAFTITSRRLSIWKQYKSWSKAHELSGKLIGPTVPAHCEHNAHMFYVKLPNLEARTKFITKLKKQDIHPVFHYVPLHTSPAGIKYGRTNGELKHTERESERIVRLPFWIGIEEHFDQVFSSIDKVLVEI